MLRIPTWRAAAIRGYARLSPSGGKNSLEGEIGLYKSRELQRIEVVVLSLL